MKPHLLFPDRDLDWQWVREAAAERDAAHQGRRIYARPDFSISSGLPWNYEALTADLSLTLLFEAMARDDDWIFEAARKAVLAGVAGDVGVIHYRQAILKDCLSKPAIIRELYALATQAMEKQRGYFSTILARHPDSVLRDAMESMAVLLGYLKALRKLADQHGATFVAPGWDTFFGMVMRDLDASYFALVETHLRNLRFGNGELVSAELGRANKGTTYKLHQAPERRWSLSAWWAELFEEKGKFYSFDLHPRDEAGAQALSALRNRGIALAATALARSADHVRNFFAALRAELAFYVGCINLEETLRKKGEPICFPVPAVPQEERLAFSGLYDVGLSLSLELRIVGNDIEADEKDIVVITGPNTGGKSTFLRSFGIAQLMMQSGMFVGAERFRSSVCNALFTHYKREEDAAMRSGKFDEELTRMSEIVDHLAPWSIVLFNESFAATNEREGSEIGRQVIAALLDSQVRVLCVTHMYELAHTFYETRRKKGMFLRAERAADGRRSFKLHEGEPLQTSYGADLYRRIFGSRTQQIAESMERQSEEAGD